MTHFKIDHLQNLLLELTISGLSSFQFIDPQKVKVVFE